MAASSANEDRCVAVRPVEPEERQPRSVELGRALFEPLRAAVRALDDPVCNFVACSVFDRRFVRAVLGSHDAPLLADAFGWLHVG